MGILYRPTFERLARLLPLLFVAMAIAVSFASIVGCGRSNRPVSASGIVTLDGRPLANASVMFSPTHDGPSAAGATNADGEFQLATTNDAGALRGEYRVSVTKREVIGMGNHGVAGQGGIRVKWLAPQKYSNFETSGLRATVGDGENKYTFDLSSR
jgi:hypothetical protein